MCRRTMKKSKSILSLLLAVILIVGLGFTVITGIGKSKSGAMKNIKLGLDLAGGVSITYQVKDKNPTKEEMSDTIYKLQKRVVQKQVYTRKEMTVLILRSLVLQMPIRFWMNLENQVPFHSRQRMEKQFLREQMLRVRLRKPVRMTWGIKNIL